MTPFRQKRIRTSSSQWVCWGNTASSSCWFKHGAASDTAWEEPSYIKFYKKREKTGPDTIELLDPGIPEVSGLSRSLLPKHGIELYGTCHKGIFTFSFPLPSQLTIHSFLLTLQLVGAIFLSQTSNSEIGLKSTSCSKQLDEGERSVHFLHVFKHLDACQQEDRTSRFLSDNFGVLLVPKGLILMLPLELLDSLAFDGSLTNVQNWKRSILNTCAEIFVQLPLNLLKWCHCF